MIRFNLKKVKGLSGLFRLKKVLSKLDHLHLSGGKLKALRSLKHQHYGRAETKLANLGGGSQVKQNSIVKTHLFTRRKLQGGCQPPGGGQL